MGSMPRVGGTPVHPSLLPKPAPPLPHAPVSFSQLSPRLVSFGSLSGKEPARCILRPEDVSVWLHSEAFHRLLWYLQAVNQAVQGKTCTSVLAERETARKLNNVLPSIAYFI
jgi:hypothetical protein